jgi:hypothetical protein
MQRDERNPYRDATLGQLARACTKLAGELEVRRPRSPSERASLAAEARYLLIVLGNMIDPKEAAQGEPEHALRMGEGRALAETFMAWQMKRLAEETHMLRRATLTRAATLVLGVEAWRWLNPDSGMLGSRPCYRGVASDEGLRMCLEELETLKESHG